MANESKHLPTTEEHGPSTEEHGPAGKPFFLSAFPRQVAVRMPKTGETVGRAWLEEAGILDAKVSREHVCFTRRGGGLQITDQKSRHGTFVDGYRLDQGRPTALEDGAILRLGQTLLVYREDFLGKPEPEQPLGGLVAPWGLAAIREALRRLQYRRGLNILVEGATGTGKELLAREISARIGRPKTVPINIAAIPRDSFEAYLFGWERYAFTGSGERNPGMLRSAEGGTVFIDEIEALPLDLQPKLLRFLEQREVSPLRANEPLPPVDVAVIAATNRSTQDLLGKDSFRRDLLARFLVRLSLPPLEERPEDIFAIFQARWEAVRGKLDLGATRVDVEAVELLMRHSWPENVRELFRLVECIDPGVGLKHSTVQQALGADLEATGPRKSVPLTREGVDKALADCQGNQSHAAKLLKVSRPQLLRWLKRNQNG